MLGLSAGSLVIVAINTIKNDQTGSKLINMPLNTPKVGIGYEQCHKTRSDYYDITEYDLKKGKIGSFNMLKSPGLYRSEHGLGTENRIVNIDTDNLAPILAVMRRYACATYFQLLTELKDNRKAVYYHQTDLRNDATDVKARSTFDEYLEELCKSGLVFRFRSHQFYINPLYAWVGDRSQYFDIDRLPFKPADVCAE